MDSAMVIVTCLLVLLYGWGFPLSLSLIPRRMISALVSTWLSTNVFGSHPPFRGLPLRVLCDD